MAMIVGGFLLASGVHLPLLGVRWTDPRPLPFKPTGVIEIAANGRVFKTSSVSLLCLRDGPHLLAKARLDWGSYRSEQIRSSAARGWTGYDAPVHFDFAVLSAATIGFRTRADVRYGPTVDRIVTDVLDAAQRKVLREAVARGMPGTLSVGFGEFGIHRMTPRADLAEVDKVLALCPAVRKVRMSLAAPTGSPDNI